KKTVGPAPVWPPSGDSDGAVATKIAVGAASAPCGTDTDAPEIAPPGASNATSGAVTSPPSDAIVAANTASPARPPPPMTALVNAILRFDVFGGLTLTTAVTSPLSAPVLANVST